MSAQQYDPRLGEATAETNPTQVANRSAVSTPLAIETAHLCRVYKGRGQESVWALRGINLKIPPRQLVVLKGRSGSGKTTLLNCIGGLDKPTRGTVRIFGSDISSFAEKDMTAFRRKQVGFIFQAFGLILTYSALENVELMLQMSGMPFQQRRERALQCLELVGLADRARHRPDEMSGGQQQRIAVARAMANQPRLLLADEPSGTLDSKTAGEILSLFRRLVEEEGITILFSSHDPLADHYADRVLQIKDGRIVA
jgi:putative ABC transport system ATP-binding protein